ncbi:MAG TPA: GNAT family N-acetyltransferase [Rhizomicrobium sp.]|nr:GNAT family N-acetyltransferase [Rhizomicrobium sp.]
MSSGAVAVEQMRHSDLDVLLNADGGVWWQRDRDVWLERLKAQDEGRMHLSLARQDGKIVGYGYLKFASAYDRFAMFDIPEIGDLRVAERCRGRGIATQMIRYLENIAATRGAGEIGLAVGLYADYGSAQRLYVRLGYVPDGRGLTYQNEPAPAGNSVRVDDDLTLWLVKSLP